MNREDLDFNLRVGERNKKDQLLILGGSYANLYKLLDNSYLIREVDEPKKEWTTDIESKAMEAYNLFNGSGMSLDFISKQFQPWYNRTHPLVEEETFEVPSFTDPTKEPYKVKRWSTGLLSCNCQGWSFRHHCSHCDMIAELSKE